MAISPAATGETKKAIQKFPVKRLIVRAGAISSRQEEGSVGKVDETHKPKNHAETKGDRKKQHGVNDSIERLYDHKLESRTAFPHG